MAGQVGRILVTGGSGFVGRHLLPRLAIAYPAADLLLPAMDVRNTAEVATLIRSAQPDVCVHLAAVSAFSAAWQDRDGAWQVNLHGTLNIARAVLEYAPLCRILYVSTAVAYGNSFVATPTVSEDAPLAPLNTYSATKAAADLALGSMVGEGLHVIRLRPINHTGPGQSPQFVVPAFARQIARIAAGLQAPLLNAGNLEIYRDFLDVRDVCRAYIACIDRCDDLAPGTIINLGSGRPQRIGDVLADLQRLAGVEAEVQVEPSRVRPDEVPMACVDATRASELLGWTPSISWEQTLADISDDWRDRVASETEGLSK